MKGFLWEGISRRQRMKCRCWSRCNKKDGSFDLFCSERSVAFRLPAFLLQLHSVFVTETPHPSR